MTYAARLLTLLFLFLSAVFRPAMADAPALTDFRGPADVRNERPYQLLFLTFTPQEATTLPTGESRLAVGLHVANDLLTPRPNAAGRVIEDTETQRLSLSYSQAVGEQTEVGVETFLLARDGGVLDALLQYYHELTGLTHASPDTPDGRHDLSFYHSIVFLQGADGEVQVDAHPTAGLGDLSLFVKRGLVARTNLAVAVRAGLKLPTGNAGTLLGSGGVDGGLDLDVSRVLSGRRALYLSVGSLWMGRDRRVTDAATYEAQYSLGLEWLVRSHDSLVLQTDGGTRVVTTRNHHADAPPSGLTLAWKRQSGPHTVCTFAFTENGDIFEYRLPQIAGIGPDVTFTAGVAWTK